MYKCNDCGSIFDEPDSEYIDLEEYYGVGSLFNDHHHEYMSVCPCCGSNDYEYYDEEEEYDD